MASLKARDVAARLNVSEKTVYKWLADGVIPATKLGRTWVVTDDALESVLSPGRRPPHRQPHGAAEPALQAQTGVERDLEALGRINALSEGAIRSGIQGVLPPRNSGDEAKRAIGEALEAARGEVLLHGIGLREFFGDMDHTPILRRIVEEDRPVSLRALLVHPLSEFARARAVAEIGGQFEDESSFRAGPLFGDSWRSLNVISSLRRAAEGRRHAKVDVRVVGHWPSVYMVLTEDRCFVETYTFGRLGDGPDGTSIEGLVPILELAPHGSYYRLLRSHFNYLWSGRNPHISVESLERVADEVRVSI